MSLISEIMEKEPYKSFLVSCKALRTKESYAHDFSRFDRWFGGKSPWDATKQDLHAYITSLKESGLADRSISRKMASLGRLYEHGVVMEIIPKDPTVIFKTFDVDPPERHPKALTKEQREHLKKSLKWSGPLNVKISLMVMLGLHTGLRLSEIHKLKWEDINFVSKKLVTIGKRNKEAYLRLSDELLQKLKEHKEEGFVLGGVKKANLDYWNRVIVKRWCGWGKEVTYSCHVLRHSYISELVDQGVPIHIAMKWARHTDTKTTLNYVTTLKSVEDAEYDKCFNKKETE